MNPNKCPIIGCEEAPAPGFECCSSKHGMMLKIARGLLKDVHFLNTQAGMSEWNWYFDEPPTRQIAEIYI